MKNSTVTIIAATVVFVSTVAAVVLLLLFGTEQTQDAITQGLVGIGGTVGASFLAWLAMRIRKDENNNGIQDDLEAFVSSGDTNDNGK